MILGADFLGTCPEASRLLGQLGGAGGNLWIRSGLSGSPAECRPELHMGKGPREKPRLEHLFTVGNRCINVSCYSQTSATALLV